MNNSATPRVCIVGAGISGLAIAWRLAQELETGSIDVIERAKHAGGHARTLTIESDQSAHPWHVDWGPGALHLSKSPASYPLRRLLHELDLTDQLVQPPKTLARRRYLYVRGELHLVPSSPVALLKTKLLSRRDKLRLLAEPLTRRPETTDESVYDFAARHLGHGVADSIVLPALLGITAGDARRLSMRALFPRVAAKDDRWRSLLVAALRGRSSKPNDTPAHDGRDLHGVATIAGGGIGAFSDAIADRLAASTAAAGSTVQTSLSLDTEVSEITRSNDEWMVTTKAGGAYERTPYDMVVLALPPAQSARLTAELAPKASTPLRAIESAAVRVTALGYRNQDLPASAQRMLEAFGALVGPDEGVPLLGCLFSSSTFPHQAPPGHTLLRTISGGSVAPDFCDLDEDQAIEQTLDSVQSVLGIDARPVMIESHAIRAAIPQYTIGHSNRVSAAELAMRPLPGLVLAGSGLHGIGLADCVAAAERVVRALVSGS